MSERTIRVRVNGQVHEQAHEAEILTVEGLAEGDRLHPLQEAFWEHHGLQCGFCTRVS